MNLTVLSPTQTASALAPIDRPGNLSILLETEYTAGIIRPFLRLLLSEFVVNNGL